MYIYIYMDFLHLIVMILVLINIYLVYNTIYLEKKSTELLSIETFDTTIDTVINDKFKVNFNSIRNLKDLISDIFNETSILTMTDNVYLKDGIINNNLTIDGNLYVRGNVQFTTKDTNFLNIFPRYMIIPWGDTIAPLGWAFCDGNIYYLDSDGNAVRSLSDVLKSQTTLQSGLLPPIQQGLLTPNLQGRFILGSGAGLDLTPRVLDDKDGVEKVVIDEDTLAAHSHQVNTTVINTPLPGTRFPNLFSPDRAKLKNQWTKNQKMNDGTELPQTVEPHENMPPFYVLNYIIKL